MPYAKFKPVLGEYLMLLVLDLVFFSESEHYCWFWVFKTNRVKGPLVLIISKTSKSFQVLRNNWQRTSGFLGGYLAMSKKLRTYISKVR
jgi:hypothetical protein